MPRVFPRRSATAARRDASGSRGPRRDPALLPGVDSSSQGPCCDEGPAGFLVACQGEDHPGSEAGGGQPDRGPGEAVLCAWLLSGSCLRRVRLRVIRVGARDGHGKPLFLGHAEARGELGKEPSTGRELAAQVRWPCPVAPRDTEETAPRGEPIRVLANVSAAAVVPLQSFLLAVPVNGF